MKSNRRPQSSKTTRGKKTDPYKPERRIRAVNSPRAPKHRGRDWSSDD